MLEVQKKESPAGIVAHFLGTINETVDLNAAAGELGPVARLDFSLLMHINSIGVKKLMRYLGELRTAGKEVHLLRCSPAIVEQMNLVPGFSSGAVVDSVCLPYFCETCNKDLSLVMNVSDLRGGKSPSEEVTCSVCKGKAVFDDLMDDYFQFLKNI